MTRFCAALCILFAIICVGFAEIEDCGSQLAEDIKITVSNCKPTSRRCVLKRDTNATLKVEFTLKEDVQKADSVVHGTILGVPIPFALPEPDACVSALKCPLEKGKRYTYEISIPVLKKYPMVTVDVKWQIQNEDKKDIVCTIIPSKIQ